MRSRGRKGSQMAIVVPLSPLHSTGKRALGWCQALFCCVLGGQSNITCKSRVLQRRRPAFRKPVLHHAKGAWNIIAMQSKDCCAKRTGTVTYHMLESPAAPGGQKMLTRSNKIMFLGSFSVLEAEAVWLCPFSSLWVGHLSLLWQHKG